MKRAIHKILKAIIPYRVGASVYPWKVLSWDYGHFRSVWKRRPVDKEGNPIPWYTYPAIDYLNQLDFSDKSIFEWGSGNSTIYWGRRSKKVVSIENNEAWYNRIKTSLPPNVEYRLHLNKEQYVNAVNDYGDLFEVIIIDGRHRHACVEQVLTKQLTARLIIFDNSDRYPAATQALRDAGLIQVDMFGLGPINHYVWCTSLYFSRDTMLTSRFKTQPYIQVQTTYRGQIVHHQTTESPKVPQYSYDVIRANELLSNPVCFST